MPDEPGASPGSGPERRPDLADTLATLGLIADPQAVERLEAFVALLLRWNRIYNLTGARDETSVVREHLIDCLAIVPVIEARIDAELKQGMRPLIVDVGSGAGFPGIVIGAVRPDWPVALVEPLSKKAAFLQQAIAALRLPQARSIGCRLEAARGRLEGMTPDLERSVWHFTSRAVASLPDLVALVRPLARPGSRLFAMKARRQEDLPDSYQVSAHSLSVPGLDKHRTLVEVLLDRPRTVQHDPTRSR